MLNPDILSAIPEAFQPLAGMLKDMNVENDVYGGNSFEIITCGRCKRELLLEDIRKAKSFIHIEYFRFGNDKAGREVRNLLIQKAREGVEVRFPLPTSNMASANGSTASSTSSTARLW